MRHRIRRIHFIGIGGIGMSGLAEILQASGHEVSGSDLHETATVQRLRSLGVRVSIGHDSRHIKDAQVAVFSAAIPATNPEVRAARAACIPVIPRAEMLAELMRMRYGVAIAGSHGKTTTTSMVGAVLREAGLDPTIIVGGVVRSLGSNSRLGEGNILVAEADESDGSFLHLVPTIVVITNVDHEHIDHYQSFERLQESFIDFANRVPFYGVCVLCLDDPGIQALLPLVTRRIRSFGLSAQAEVSADRIVSHRLRTRFVAKQAGRELGEIRLRGAGKYTVRNALAAITVGLEHEVDFEIIRGALENFSGVERRFEICGEIDDVLVVSDYAHHPTEIRATLEAARSLPERRVVVAFQPHRYTRTRDLLKQFAGAFHDADVLVMSEIYAAGEPKIPGVDAKLLVDAIRDHGHRDIRLVPDLADLVATLRTITRAGDLLIFMGAGNIGHQPRTFLDSGGEAD